ncbi:MAG: insulinase family protein [Candidatus Omnitrophica bacterium]|nr:insulinase family protein [Candidatus Omnitrophota bacterium]
MYHKEVFDNGVRVVLYPMPHMSSATVGVWIGTGSRYESEMNTGISHFLEHLLFKGTERRTCRQIKEAIESKGGVLNAFTGEEMTCYWAKVIPRHLPEAIDVLCDMTRAPLLATEEIEKEKRVIVEEISMYLDLPMHYVHILFDKLLWPDQPLGQLIVGTREVVRSFNQKILRQYMRKFYSAENITIAISGAMSIEDALKAAAPFKELPKREKNIFAGVRIEQKEPRVNLFHKKTEQIHLCMGGRGYHRSHPDRYPLILLDTILGGNMTSRLFEEIREKRGLAYEIRSTVHLLADTGSFVVSAGIALDKLSETVKLILKEFERIKQEDVSDLELVQAKDYCRGQLLLSLESTSSYMQWLGEHELTLARIPTPEEVIAKIDAVKSSDIKRIANELFVNENLCLATIGPVEDIEKNSLTKDIFLLS